MEGTEQRLLSVLAVKEQQYNQKPQMVVNALKQIYFPPMEPFDGATLINYAITMSRLMNILTHSNYV